MLNEFYFFLVSPTIFLHDQDEPLRSTNVVVGAELNLSITIVRFNLPLTNITWMHNGNILVDKEKRVTITNPNLSDPAPVMAMLQRTSLIPLDSGEYVVTATNSVGSGMLNFSVTVIGEYGK